MSARGETHCGAARTLLRAQKKQKSVKIPVSVMSVKKPKTLDEVWENASTMVNDALRNLDNGITRNRFMTCYS